MHKQVLGRTGRVVLAQFDQDEDLLEGIRLVLREQHIHTGYIASITGSLSRATLQRFSRERGRSVENVVVPGPLEVSGHGIFGRVVAPGRGSTPFGGGAYVDGEPYVHVHLTATSADHTMCGHLISGNPVRSAYPVSHFTVFIVEVVGAALEERCDSDGSGYHFIGEAPTGLQGPCA
jgi:predicted DNA-binding protein with PD1-like motif